MYSLAETAKENGARPYYYYKYLLEKASALQKEHEKDGVTDLEYLDPMMPWSEEYRQYEKSELARDNSIQRQLALDGQTKNTQNVSSYKHSTYLMKTKTTTMAQIPWVSKV